MSRRLSTLSLATILSASGAQAAPSLQEVSHNVTLATRDKTEEIFKCDPVEPHLEPVKIVIDKPISMLSAEAVNLPFLSLYNSNTELRQMAKSTYELLFVTRDFFGPVLLQMKEKFGHHVNWAAYEAKVRAELEDVESTMLKIQSGQVTADELAFYSGIGTNRGDFWLVIRMLTRGAARECFGVSKTSIVYRSKVVQD